MQYFDGYAGGDPGVVVGQLQIGGQRLAAGQILYVGEQEGSGVLAMYALLLGHGKSAVDNGLHLVKVKLILLGYGVGYERAALQAHIPFCFDYAGYLIGVLCVVVYPGTRSCRQ